jgi:hypothetical protein
MRYFQFIQRNYLSSLLCLILQFTICFIHNTPEFSHPTQVSNDTLRIFPIFQE